jgi:hypothetical protein
VNWAQPHRVALGASWGVGASALPSPYQRPRSSSKTRRRSEIGEAHDVVEVRQVTCEPRCAEPSSLR